MGVVGFLLDTSTFLWAVRGSSNLSNNALEVLNNANIVKYISSVCHEDVSDFYFTHGDAGGNFFVARNQNFLVDWDEVMYAPIERDAWVMSCHK